MDFGPDTQGLPSQRSMERGGVNNLVSLALSVLTAKGGAIAPDYSSPQMQAICDAFVAPDEDARHEVLAALLSHGVAETDIIEHIIPTTAHLLGERWFNDTLSFADVTIGSARLQETIRALAKDRTSAPALTGDCVLLVVPRNEFHTLGVFVAAHQFRRHGIDVQLAVGQHPRQIVQMVQRHRFPLVGITASGQRSLAAARDMIDAIRDNVPRITRVAIGGSVTLSDLDIRKITGADIVTSDPAKVISECGLNASPMLESADAE